MPQVPIARAMKLRSDNSTGHLPVIPDSWDIFKARERPDEYLLALSGWF
jgi:hypothetical protein